MPRVSWSLQTMEREGFVGVRYGDGEAVIDASLDIAHRRALAAAMTGQEVPHAHQDELGANKQPHGLLRSLLTAEPPQARIVRPASLNPADFSRGELEMLSLLARGRPLNAIPGALSKQRDGFEERLDSLAARLQLPANPVALGTIATLANLDDWPEFTQSYINRHPQLRPKPVMARLGDRPEERGMNIFGGVVVFVPKVPLNARARAACILAMLGRSEQKIGQALGIAESTARSVLRDAYHDVGASGKRSLLYTLLTSRPRGMHVLRPIMPGLISYEDADDQVIMSDMAAGRTYDQIGKKRYLGKWYVVRRAMHLFEELPVQVFAPAPLAIGATVLSGHVADVPMLELPPPGEVQCREVAFGKYGVVI